MKIPHVYIVAGEPSGDRLGARLIAAVRRKTGDKVKLSGIGGPEMEAQGLKSYFPMSELTGMGFLEILPKLPNIVRRIKDTVTHILSNKPDVVITIDIPDFSFRVAKRLRGKNIPLIHYVAPSVWAWKPSRAKKIAAIIDHLLTLLPFEPAYFTREGLVSSFVGHPVIESGADQGDGINFRTRHNIPTEAKVLCLLPGSRQNEVVRILPVLKDTVQLLNYANLHLVMPTTAAVKAEVCNQLESWDKIPIVVSSDRDKFAAFSASNCGIAASGTVSLELAIAGVPHVTVYKVNWLTAVIARRMVRTPYVNLINILLDREVVPELIQEACKSDIIASYISSYLIDSNAAKAQINSFNQAIIQLQNGDIAPSDKAANIVIDIIG